MQEKLREKSEGFNELVIKKELADRQMLMQEEEIKRLEETNAGCRREAAQLREELEKQRDAVKALQQVAVCHAGGSAGPVGLSPPARAAVPALCREDQVSAGPQTGLAGVHPDPCFISSTRSVPSSPVLPVPSCTHFASLPTLPSGNQAGAEVPHTPRSPPVLSKP